MASSLARRLAEAAIAELRTSPLPVASSAPFRSLAAIGSGAEDDRCESGSVIIRLVSALRNDRRNDQRYTIWLPSAIRNDRRYYSNWAWTPWEQTTPKEIPPSPQTGTPSLFFKVVTSPRAPPSFRALICPGPLIFRPKRLSQLPSVHTTGQRHTSSWAWTPWEPNRPKDKQTSHQRFEQAGCLLRRVF
ncbi:uncharacterized protein [Miscanthus floridulus]|uniref:uncharacterized protein isoform X2 n=1 Tax=Miscanthus floridulus TaxID=154761 RepID=UPI00345A5FD5